MLVRRGHAWTRCRERLPHSIPIELNTSPPREPARLTVVLCLTCDSAHAFFPATAAASSSPAASARGPVSLTGVSAISTRAALIAAEAKVVLQAGRLWKQNPGAAIGVMPDFIHVMTRSGLSDPTYTPITSTHVSDITSPLVMHLSNPVNEEFTLNDNGDRLALTFERLHAALDPSEWPASSLSGVGGLLQILMAEMSPLITHPAKCPPVTQPPFLTPCITIIIAILATAPPVIIAFGRSVQERWRRCWEYGGEIDEVHHEHGICWYRLRYTLDGEERTTFVVECIHPSFPSDDRDVELLITASLLLVKALALTGKPPEKGVFTDAMKAAGKSVRMRAMAAKPGSIGRELLAAESWDAGFELLKRMFGEHGMKMGISGTQLGPLGIARLLALPNPERVAGWVSDVFQGRTSNRIALMQRITEWCRDHKPQRIDMFYHADDAAAARMPDEPEEMKLDDHDELVDGVTVQYSSKARLQAYRCIVENCTSPAATHPLEREAASDEHASPHRPA